MTCLLCSIWVRTGSSVSARTDERSRADASGRQLAQRHHQAKQGSHSAQKPCATRAQITAPQNFDDFRNPVRRREKATRSRIWHRRLVDLRAALCSARRQPRIRHHLLGRCHGDELTSGVAASVSDFPDLSVALPLTLTIDEEGWYRLMAVDLVLPSHPSHPVWPAAGPKTVFAQRVRRCIAITSPSR